MNNKKRSDLLLWNDVLHYLFVIDSLKLDISTDIEISNFKLKKYGIKFCDTHTTSYYKLVTDFFGEKGGYH